MSFDKRAFNAYGPTVKVAGAIIAPLGVSVPSAPAADQFRVMNDGVVTAFYAYGIDAATAQTNAVIPTGSGANSKNSIPLPAGGIEIISAPANSYFSAITASGTADVYVTPGRGL